MYKNNDFIISVKVGSGYLPIVSFTNGQENNLFFVFNENLSEAENSQYTLTFDVIDKQYIDGSEISCPFLHLLYIGAELRLEWNYTIIDFVISNIAPQHKSNGTIYSFTAKDEVFYRWQKQHLGYSFTTVDDEGNVNVQNIYDIARTVLNENYLLYDATNNPKGWRVASFTGDTNDEFNQSIGYDSLIDQQFSLEITDSNPYNVIIEACSTANAFMKVDYKKRLIDFFRKNDVKDSGYRYRPDYNLLSHSVDYSGDELCTILHVHGGVDADERVVSLIPPLSFALKKYIETQYNDLSEDNCLSVARAEIYDPNTGQIKNDYQPTIEIEDMPFEIYEGAQGYVAAALQPTSPEIEMGQRDFLYDDNSNRVRISFDEGLRPYINSCSSTNINIYNYKTIQTPEAERTDWKISASQSTPSCYYKDVFYQDYAQDEGEYFTEADRPYQCFPININSDLSFVTTKDGTYTAVLDFCFDSDIDIRIARNNFLFGEEASGNKDACCIKIQVKNSFLTIQYNTMDFSVNAQKYTDIKPLHQVQYKLNSSSLDGRWKHLIIKVFCDYTKDGHKLEMHTEAYYNGRPLAKDEKKFGPYIANPPTANFLSYLFGSTSGNDLLFVVADSGTRIEATNDMWDLQPIIRAKYYGYIGEVNFDRASGDKTVGYELPEDFYSNSKYTSRYFNHNTISWYEKTDNTEYQYFSVYRANYNPLGEDDIKTALFRRNSDLTPIIQRQEQNLRETDYFFAMAEKVPYLGQFLMDFSYFKQFRIITDEDINEFQSNICILNFRHQYETMSLLSARTNLRSLRNELESLAQTYASIIYTMLDNNIKEADEDTNLLIQEIQERINNVISSYVNFIQIIGPSSVDYISSFGTILQDQYFNSRRIAAREQISKYDEILNNEDNPERIKAQEDKELLLPFCYNSNVSITLNGKTYTQAPSAYDIIINSLSAQTIVHETAIPYNMQYYFNTTKQDLDAKMSNFYRTFAQSIYEQYYENQDELDSKGLYNQAMAYMADYNKIKGSYSTTVLDIATLDSIGHPKATVGDFIYVYNPASVYAFPLLNIINAIENKQQKLQNYKDNFKFNNVSITQIEALQNEIAILKEEAKQEYRNLFGTSVAHYQQLLNVLYTDKLYITSISRILREPLKDSITVEEQSQYKNIISKLIKNI